MINGYRLVKLLGRGSFGEVWLAETEADGSRVAIKFLHDITAGALNRFRREVRLLTEHIDNRFVVDIKAHDLNAASPYFVMEFCEGGSLRQFVGKPWAWQAAARVLSCAVQGLTGLHRVVGYHRDIKPDNLLLRCNSKWRSIPTPARPPTRGLSSTAETRGAHVARRLDKPLRRRASRPFDNA